MLELPDTFPDWYARDVVQAWWKKYADRSQAWRTKRPGVSAWWHDPEGMILVEREFAWMLIGAATASGRGTVEADDPFRWIARVHNGKLFVMLNEYFPDPMSATMAWINADIEASK